MSNGWNPFQTPLSLEDNGTTGNGLGINMISPTGSASSSSALGFGLNRTSNIGNGVSNGLGASFMGGGGYGMRGMGQQASTGSSSSSSLSMFNAPNRVTSPFSQPTTPSSMSSLNSFDNFSTGRNVGQQPKDFTSSSFQQGFRSNNDVPTMNGGLGYDSKPMTNGWNSMNGYGYGSKPSAPVAPTSKFGSIGGMSGGFTPQPTFNEPGMFQRSNSLNMGMYRPQPQVSPPMSAGPSGGGGDIFSQADMFSADPSGGRKQNVDNFKAGRWDSGPSRPGDGPPGSQGARETGIIEKLLHSYGFIQCCERQARLFFHFSQFDGNIEHLKIGDPVEFEMTYDRRTGKPIASSVTKISSEVVSQQMQGEERVLGTVTTEISAGGPGRPEISGRISYENRGECFFLPYGRNDIEGHVTLSVGDRVSFLIATDQRTGNLAARCVRLENPAAPVRYRGIIASMTGETGFIERGDVVRQIGFTVSELEEDIKVGHHVEFSIQTTNGKELAGSIKRLADGTVVFEDVDAEVVRGQVLKTAERRDSPDLVAPAMNSPNSTTSMFGNGDHSGDSMSGKWTPPSMGPSANGSLSTGSGSSSARNRAAILSGRIRYRGKDRSEVEIPFGESDQKGNFTLRHGDWVSFQIAVDRRDQQQRATGITLLDDSFMVSGEKREQGIVRKLEKESVEKPAEGLIECVERDALVNFTVHELLDESETLHVKDEVELTVVEKWVPAGGTRSTGLRIKKLPRGTVQFHSPLQDNLTGEVSKEAPVGKDDQPGFILVDDEHCPPGCANTEVAYFPEEKDENILVEQDKTTPEIGDKVRFDLVQLKKNRKLMAVRVKVIEARPPLIDPNTEVPPLPPSPLHEDAQQAQLAPFFAPVPDTLPSPLKPLQACVMTPSPTASTASSPAPQSVYYDEHRADEPLIQGLSNPPVCLVRKPVTGEMFKGYIAGVKEREGFGFIEKLERDSDVYFRLAAFDGDAATLEVGAEVRYCLSEKVHQSGRESADYVTLVPAGITPVANIRPEVLLGVVMRPLKSWNQEQVEYCGLIKNGTSDDVDGQMYEFGVTCIAKRVQLEVGDAVQFQVETTTGKAVNIKPCRNKLRSTVEAVKGTYGFLSYEYEEGKKLYYNQSEVKDKSNLQIGDQVEFELVTNKRNGKAAACSITKLSESQRPERLISRLRAMHVVDGKRVKLVRQPRGPDGTKGFHPRGLNGALNEANGTPSPPSSPISMASSVSSL